MQRNLMDDIEYTDKGCWYYDSCLSCPFDNCILPDNGKPLTSSEVRNLKRKYPFLKGQKVKAIQNGKVVMA